MNRSTRLGLNLLFLPLVLILLATNAHAFLVNTELGSFSVEFVPADSNSTMSVEWDSYLVHARATTYQQRDHKTDQKSESVVLLKPESTTVEVSTEETRTAISVDDSDATITADVGEDTADRLHCRGHWEYERNFTVHGDGWLVISAVHNAEFETDPSFDLDLRSTAEITLYNYFTDNSHRDVNDFSEVSSGLTGSLDIKSFFNDGDSGRLNTYLDTYVANYDNAVPIPGALLLLGSGLPFLLAIKRRGR